MQVHGAVQVQCIAERNTDAVKAIFLPVLPNRLLKAQTDTHSYTTCRETWHKVLHVNVKLAAIISLNIHDILLSVIYMRKQNPLKLNKNANYFY